MSVYVKVKTAQMRIIAEKLHKKAQKLALAVVITEYLLVGGWYFAETMGLLEFLQPKTVIIQIAKPVEAKEQPKPQEIKEISDIDRIADNIWNLESTRGKHNYSKCEAIGKVNGIGYGIPGNGKYICFENHAEEMETLKRWIEDKQEKGMTENELMCFYNTGKTAGIANGTSYQVYCNN